jgi:hypothetical protein
MKDGEWARFGGNTQTEEYAMYNKHIVIKYYSSRMLLTFDMNALFMALFDTYGEDVTVEFVSMNERERRESIDEEGGIPVVRDRFQVFETGEPHEMQRRTDVEQIAIATGRGKGVRKAWETWGQSEKDHCAGV